MIARLRRRLSPAPPVDEVVELLSTAVEDLRGIDLVLYGSTVHHGRVVGDIDLWLAGPAWVVAEVRKRLEGAAGSDLPLLDIASPGGPPDLEAAVRWCVARDGIVIAGRPPTVPPEASFHAAALAFRAAAVRQARLISHKADVVARGGSASAAWLAEQAFRSWVHTLAADHEEERRLRRLQTREQLVYVARREPDLLCLLRQYSWSSPLVTTRIAGLAHA